MLVEIECEAHSDLADMFNRLDTLKTLRVTLVGVVLGAENVANVSLKNDLVRCRIRIEVQPPGIVFEDLAAIEQTKQWKRDASEQANLKSLSN